MLNKHGIVSTDILDAVYTPLNLVCQMVPGSGFLVEKYMSLWVDESKRGEPPHVSTSFSRSLSRKSLPTPPRTPFFA